MSDKSFEELGSLRMSYKDVVGTNAVGEGFGKAKKGWEGQCGDLLKRRASMVSMALERRGGDS